MADEEVGQPVALLEILQQVEDLSLDRLVQRRHRFVAEDQFRMERQRAGDIDALALAAAELVRIVGGVVGVQTDLLKQIGRSLGDLGAADAVRAQRKGDVSPIELRGFSDE